MKPGRSGNLIRDVVYCADILGSFGVTPADLRTHRREYQTTVPPRRTRADESLETIIADVLADARDRTTTVRQLICQSDRGLVCSARYEQRALARELEAVFESIGWSLEWTRTDPDPNDREGLELTAADPNGRRRATTITYPTTPLADDNLPAVLHAVDEHLLAGTGATFVLLSAGADRWRAALLQAAELEALRAQYGPRISAFDRPLLPEHGLEAYASAAADANDPVGLSSVDPDDPGPWPLWALERADRRSNGVGAADRESSLTRDASEPTGSEPLIDEAETESGAQSGPTELAEVRVDDAETDGVEPRDGLPAVPRMSDGGSNLSADATGTDSVDSSRDENALLTRAERGARRAGDGGTSDPGEDGLIGPRRPNRIDDDVFGTGDAFETVTDRYRAFGAALGAGGAISVEGLLEDDEFVPELPAATSPETRLEFAEAIDPDASASANAADGPEVFEWVDADSLETRDSDR